MKYIRQHIFLNNNLVFLPLFTIVAFLAFYLAVFFLAKCQKLTIKLFSLIEEYALSIILSFWIFSVFYLHWAIFVWIIGYIGLSFFCKQNYIIKNIATQHNNKTNLSKSQDKLHKKICTPFNPHKLIFRKITKQIRNQRKEIVESYISSDTSIKKFWGFPFNIYIIGLIIPWLYNIIWGTQYENTDYIIFVFLENYLGLIGILLILYPLMRLITVENIGHHLYMEKRLFNSLFAILSIILFLVFTGISLGHK